MLRGCLKQLFQQNQTKLPLDMSQTDWKKAIVPHLAAMAIFIVISFMFFYYIKNKLIEFNV